MRKSTTNLGNVNVSHLRGWSVKLPSASWPEIAKDMPTNHEHWRSCYNYLLKQNHWKVRFVPLFMKAITGPLFGSITWTGWFPVIFFVVLRWLANEMTVWYWNVQLLITTVGKSWFRLVHIRFTRRLAIWILLSNFQNCLAYYLRAASMAYYQQGSGTNTRD